MKWKPGDRVCRLTYMDDGTWVRLGDKCMKDSPKSWGTVIRRSTDRDDEVVVRFDDGSEKRYLDHGVHSD